MLQAIIRQWNTFFFFSLRPPSARELELEDRQSRLQQELRERMAVEGECSSVAGTSALNASVRVMSLTPGSPVAPVRPPEDGEGARSGEADPERDVGGGGAAGRPGGPPGWAASSWEGGGQGPGGCHALQGLQPQLGLKELILDLIRIVCWTPAAVNV